MLHLGKCPTAGVICMSWSMRKKITNKFKQSLSNFEPWNSQYFKQHWWLGPYQSCLYKKKVYIHGIHPPPPKYLGGPEHKFCLLIRGLRCDVNFWGELHSLYGSFPTLLFAGEITKSDFEIKLRSTVSLSHNAYFCKTWKCHSSLTHWKGSGRDYFTNSEKTTNLISGFHGGPCMFYQF